MDWTQGNENCNFETIIDTEKLSPNSLCEAHSPSTSFAAEITDESDEKLSVHEDNTSSNDNGTNNDINETIEDGDGMPESDANIMSIENSANFTEVEAFVNSLKQFFNNVASTTDNLDTTNTVATSINPSVLLPNGNKNLVLSSTRRRRPRRNPVWQYFRVENSLAVCKHCNYNTKSVFSTNLKVHLRSHHRKLFDSVAEAEKAMEISSKNAANAVKVLKACTPTKSQLSSCISIPPSVLSNYLFKATMANSLQNDCAQTQDMTNLILVPQNQNVIFENNELKQQQNIDAFFLNNNSHLNANENDEEKNEIGNGEEGNNNTHSSLLAVLAASPLSNNDQLAISNILSNSPAFLSNTCDRLSQSLLLSHNNLQIQPQNSNAEMMNLSQLPLQHGSTLVSSNDLLDSSALNFGEIASDLRTQIDQLIRNGNLNDEMFSSIQLEMINSLSAKRNGESMLSDVNENSNLALGCKRNFVNEPAANLLNTNTNNSNERFKQRRKRLRRHPVWNFFKDVEDKIVGCVMCNFRTTSAFSTNLKMHLKAHHKEQFIQVLQSEQDQLGGLPADAEGEFEAVGNRFVSSVAQFCARTGRMKRRRKTAEEIQAIIDKCKTNLAKERQKRVNLNLGVNSALSAVTAHVNNEEAANLTNLWKALQFRDKKLESTGARSVSSFGSTENEYGLDSIIENPESKLYKTEFSPSEQLNAVLGIICNNNNNINGSILDNNENKFLKNNNIYTNNNISNVLLSNEQICQKQQSQLNNVMKDEKLSVSKSNFSSILSNGTNGVICNLVSKSSTPSPNSDSSVSSTENDEIQKIFAIANTSENKEIRSALINKGLDLALSKIIERLGSSTILRIPAFKSIISTLAPDYDYYAFSLNDVNDNNKQLFAPVDA